MINLEWHTEDIYTDYLLGFKDGKTYVLGDVTQIESKVREDENGIRTQFEYEVETVNRDKIKATLCICCTYYKEPVLWVDFTVQENEDNCIDLGGFNNRNFAKKLLEDEVKI